MEDDLSRLRNIIEAVSPDESKLSPTDRRILDLIDEALEGGEETGLCVAQQFRYRKERAP